MAGIKSREESIREEMDAPLNLDVNVDVRIPKSNQMTEKNINVLVVVLLGIHRKITFLNQQMYYGKAMMAIFLFVIHVEMLTIISLLIYLMVMKVRQSNIFVCNLVGCTILKD